MCSPRRSGPPFRFGGFAYDPCTTRGTDTRRRSPRLGSRPRMGPRGDRYGGDRLDVAMTRVVISKDRALQLHAFIRSFRAHVSPTAVLDVLYRATTRGHAHAYAELFATCGDGVRAHRDQAFARDFLALLPSDGFAIVFADDHVFVRDWVEEEREINLHL